MALTLVERIREYAGDTIVGNPVMSDDEYQRLIDNLKDADGLVSDSLLYLAAAQALERHLQLRAWAPEIAEAKRDLIAQYRSSGYAWLNYGARAVVFQGRQHGGKVTPTTSGGGGGGGGQAPAQGGRGGGLTQTQVEALIGDHEAEANAHHTPPDVTDYLTAAAIANSYGDGLAPTDEATTAIVTTGDPAQGNSDFSARAGHTHLLDASALPDAGLSQAEVDARIVAGVQSPARTGSAAVWPLGKLPPGAAGVEYTAAEQTKLAGIAAGAEANVGVEYTAAEKAKLAGYPARLPDAGEDNVFVGFYDTLPPVANFAVGEAIINTGDGRMYRCIDANTASNTYTWTFTPQRPPRAPGNQLQDSGWNQRPSTPQNDRYGISPLAAWQALTLNVDVGAGAAEQFYFSTYATEATFGDGGLEVDVGGETFRFQPTAPAVDGVRLYDSTNQPARPWLVGQPIAVTAHANGTRPFISRAKMWHFQPLAGASIQNAVTALALNADKDELSVSHRTGAGETLDLLVPAGWAAAGQPAPAAHPLLAFVDGNTQGRSIPNTGQRYEALASPVAGAPTFTAASRGLVHIIWTTTTDTPLPSGLALDGAGTEYSAEVDVRTLWAAALRYSASGAISEGVKVRGQNLSNGATKRGELETWVALDTAGKPTTYQVYNPNGAGGGSAESINFSTRRSLWYQNQGGVPEAGYDGTEIQEILLSADREQASNTTWEPYNYTVPAGKAGVFTAGFYMVLENAQSGAASTQAAITLHNPNTIIKGVLNANINQGRSVETSIQRTFRAEAGNRIRCAVWIRNNSNTGNINIKAGSNINLIRLGD